MSKEPACLTAALEYLRRGWSALALCPPDHSGQLPPVHLEHCKKPGKAPPWPWKEYQTQRAKEQVLRALWNRNPGCNVGIALGPVSRLVGLDVDGEEGQDVLRDLLEEHEALPATLSFTTGGGGRRYLFVLAEGEDPAPWSLKGPTGAEALRLLAKGTQTVMPPSRTAGPYQWDDGCRPGEIEPAPLPAWLVTRPAWKPTAPANRLPPRSAVPAYLLDDARDYLRKMGPCDPRPENQEQDASTHLLKAANVLVIGFAFDDDTALTLLAEWDQANSCGPYPEKEYRRKIAAAHAKPNFPPKYPARVGYLLTTRQPARVDAGHTQAPPHNGPAAPPNGNGHAPDGPGRPGCVNVHPAGNGKAGGKEKPKRPPPEIFSADWLMRQAFPPLSWAVPQIIPEGVSILAGRPKSGKSWLIMNLALAITGGGVALGKYDVKKGPVLYLALEDGPRRLQRRLAKLLARQNGKVPDGLEFCTAWPRWCEGGALAIEEWLEAHPGARLVVVDTLARVRDRRTATGGVYEEDYAALAELIPVAIKYGVAILVITHTRKASAEDPFDEISGSLGQMGAADGGLVLRRNRRENTAVLYTTGRDLEEEQELHLLWEPEHCLWSLCDGPPPSKPKDLGTDQARIVQAIRIAGHPLAPVEIYAALEIPEADHERWKKRIQRLAENNGPLVNEGRRYQLRSLSQVSQCPNAGSSGETDGYVNGTLGQLGHGDGELPL